MVSHLCWKNPSLQLNPSTVGVFWIVSWVCCKQDKCVAEWSCFLRHKKPCYQKEAGRDNGFYLRETTLTAFALIVRKSSPPCSRVWNMLISWKNAYHWFSKLEYKEGVKVRLSIPFSEQQSSFNNVLVQTERILFFVSLIFKILILMYFTNLPREIWSLLWEPGLCLTLTGQRT